MKIVTTFDAMPPYQFDKPDFHDFFKKYQWINFVIWITYFSNHQFAIHEKFDLEESLCEVISGLSHTVVNLRRWYVSFIILTLKFSLLLVGDFEYVISFSLFNK